jgi:glycerate kinase
VKILVSPASYKGFFSAHFAATLMEAALKSTVPNATIRRVPVADGGDDTLEVLSHVLDIQILEVNVHDPFMQPCKAAIGFVQDGQTAVVESAQAVGIARIPKEMLNPLIATTYGVGEMLAYVFGLNCKQVILTVGGTATNDAGAGMAVALGYRLLDANGKDVPLGAQYLGSVRMIISPEVEPWAQTKVVVATDVENPLCGEMGASYIFGPQKGANPQQVAMLDSNLCSFAKVIKEYLNIDVLNLKGAGAGGGLGAGAFAFLRATYVSGAVMIADLLTLESYVQDADLIITGEGCLDYSSTHGKAPWHVINLAISHRKAVLVVPGLVKLDSQYLSALVRKGVFVVESSSVEGVSPEEKLINAVKKGIEQILE